MHEPQADQGEVGLVVLDRLGLLEHQGGEAAGRDDVRLATELGGDASYDPVDLSDEAVEQTRLQRLGRGLADDRAGPRQLDLEQSRAAGREGVDGDLDAGGEGTTEELPRDDTTS